MGDDFFGWFQNGELGIDLGELRDAVVPPPSPPPPVIGRPAPAEVPGHDPGHQWRRSPHLPLGPTPPCRSMNRRSDEAHSSAGEIAAAKDVAVVCSPHCPRCQRDCHVSPPPLLSYPRRGDGISPASASRSPGSAFSTRKPPSPPPLQGDQCHWVGEPRAAFQKGSLVSVPRGATPACPPRSRSANSHSGVTGARVCPAAVAGGRKGRPPKPTASMHQASH